ncbi:MAG TPA: taurine dioxygenase [Acidimicrobiaceae bacterium]|nr:taurine dioxygenase [Acidimicrobiaceae bacterium]
MLITPERVGATVSDVDVRQLNDDATTQLANAWAEHGVLFFRDQELTPDDHITFAERFASIDVNKFFKPVETHPKIATVLKEADQQGNIGGAWHTDHTYDQIPARGSILLAREVPPVGGDTRFADVAAAYDALSPGLQKTLESLEAVHSNEHVFGKSAQYNREMGDRLGNPEGVGNAVHPVVIQHPQTGRKLLYVNLAFTRYFVGWTMEESAPLLQYLYEHVGQYQFTTQFQWDVGSIAMWDNRSTWHWALNDYPGHRRLMHRITVAGEALSPATS